MKLVNVNADYMEVLIINNVEMMINAELIGNGMCDKGFTWSPIDCECEPDKLCDVGQYLDYKHCIYTKRLIDRLVEECSENSHRTEIIYNNALWKNM